MGQITEINNDIHFAPKNQKSKQKAPGLSAGANGEVGQGGFSGATILSQARNH
jgi:hypothetical protein